MGPYHPDAPARDLGRDVAEHGRRGGGGEAHALPELLQQAHWVDG